MGRERRLAARRSTLWIATELYYPEETSTGHVMTAIAENLAAHGPVRVLCAQPTYSARGTRSPAREVHRGVHIQRVWSTTWNHRNLLLRMANLLTITASIFLHALVQLRRSDQVLVVTNPPSLPFAIAVACWLRRASWTLLVHDVFPDLLVAARVRAPGSPLVRLLDRAHRILYRHAEHIVVIGRCMKARLERKLDDGSAGKVQVIPNWADTDVVSARPRQGSRFLEELGLEDKCVVQFAGNIGPLNDIANLLDAIELLRDDHHLHFLFVGRGSRREWLAREVEHRGLPNVSLVDWLPRSRSAEMHRGCDLGLISMIAGLAGISVPSRLYNALAAGRPLVAVTEPNSELARVIDEHGLGWLVEPGRPERLADTLRRAASADDLKDMGARARTTAEAHFSRQRIMDQWVNLFHSGDEAPEPEPPA